MSPADTAASTAPVAPVHWPWAMASRPNVCSEQASWRGALFRAWSGTSPIMVQPPLDQHYIVMHLGGAKRVSRRNDGPPACAVAEPGSLTLVPAGTAYVWKTEGPIAFSHLYLRPRDLERVAASGEPAGDSRGDSLIEAIGCRDGQLERVLHRMHDVLRCSEAPSALLLDSLLESFCIRLKQRHTPAPTHGRAQAESLAPHRLRRVLDFIDAHLGADLALADLVAAAGTSQYHFSRAFGLATGLSPYRYLLRRRIEYARVLLIASDDSLSSISASCGFNSRRQFAVMFKRIVGVGPKRFRLAQGGAARAEDSPRRWQ